MHPRAEAMRSYLEMFPEDRPKIEGERRILLVTVPSIVKVGEEFDLRLTMMDLSGMPDEGYEGLITLTPSEESLEVPDKVELKPRDRGRLTVRGLRATHPGAYVIQAEVDGSPSPGPSSNPLLARESPRRRLYWGDIHVHSVYSNCHADYAKHPEFAYWYAREVAHLDFCAVTDHVRGLTPSRWADLKRLADKYYTPGRFVTFLGFESSHAKEFGGDINVYYESTDGDYFWLEREDMKGTTPKVPLSTLYAWLEHQGMPFIVVPHHTPRAGKYRDFDLPYYAGKDEPVLEVFSMWGSSEARNDGLYLKGGKATARAYLEDALALGYRYGVIGSSDTHHTLPGSPVSSLPRPYHHPPNKLTNQGLAAVYGPSLTRRDLFASLRLRSCYATTSTRPIIDFQVNGVPMGSSLVVGEKMLGDREISLSIYTSIRPGLVEIIRNNQILYSFRLADGVETHYTFTDRDDPRSLWITGAPMSKRPFFYYYLRVTFLGDHSGIRAWSSPIWVEKG